jgi:integration host factor subunit alpha
MELSFDHIQTPSLTKAELGELLFEQVGLNKREAKDFIDEFFEVIIRTVANGEDVKISGFGNFHVRTKDARPGRNPRTGEPVEVAARRSVTFHCSPALKDAIKHA